MKTCYDLKKLGIKYDCCNACHENLYEFDYAMTYRIVDGFDYHVCCGAPSDEEIKTRQL